MLEEIDSIVSLGLGDEYIWIQVGRVYHGYVVSRIVKYPHSDSLVAYGLVDKDSGQDKPITEVPASFFQTFTKKGPERAGTGNIA